MAGGDCGVSQEWGISCLNLEVFRQHLREGTVPASRWGWWVSSVSASLAHCFWSLKVAAGLGRVGPAERLTCGAAVSRKL